MLLTVAQTASAEVLTLRSAVSALEPYQYAIRATAPPPGVLSIDAMEAARHAPHARVVTGSLPGSWFRPLPEDPSAVWINETGSASSGQSVLYAVDFDVTDPFETASLRLTVAVDNRLGPVGSTEGVFLNGVPLPGSFGGTHEVPTTFAWREIGGLLRPGRNTLLIWASDTGLAGGILFSARIETFPAPEEPVALALHASPLARVGTPIQVSLEALNYTGGRIPLSIVVIEIGDPDVDVTVGFEEDVLPGFTLPDRPAFVLRDHDRQYVAFLLVGLPESPSTPLGTIAVRADNLGPHGESRVVPVRGTIVPVDTGAGGLRFDRLAIECLADWFRESLTSDPSLTLADLATLIPCALTAANCLAAIALEAGTNGLFLDSFQVSLKQVTENCLLEFATCAGSLAASGALALRLPNLALAKELTGFACFVTDVAATCGVISSRGPCGWGPPLTWRGPLDPNEKVGLGPGLSDEYLSANAEFVDFVIHFENDARASAPAATVVVVDTLDTRTFDPAGLQLGSVFFDTFSTDLGRRPAGSRALVDMRPQADLLVTVETATHASSSGDIVRWSFRTLDPRTMQPPADPLAGFLPPNSTGTEGMGGVAFRVPLRPGLPDGHAVRNRATIHFDQNAPITTPDWLRVVDATPPVVDALECRTLGGDVWCTVRASDLTAGVDRLVLSALVDGERWLHREVVASGSVDTTVAVLGLPPGTVSLRAAARDRAENWSSPRDATVVLDYVQSGLRLIVMPNPCPGSCLLRARGDSSPLESVRVVDVAGRLVRDLRPDRAVGTRQVRWDGRNSSGLPAASGIYFVDARARDGSRDLRRVVLLR